MEQRIVFTSECLPDRSQKNWGFVPIMTRNLTLFLERIVVRPYFWTHSTGLKFNKGWFRARFSSCKVCQTCFHNQAVSVSTRHSGGLWRTVRSVKRAILYLHWSMPRRPKSLSTLSIYNEQEQTQWRKCDRSVLDMIVCKHPVQGARQKNFVYHGRAQRWPTVHYTSFGQGI